MEYTPRISPSDQQAQRDLVAGGPGTWVVQLIGYRKVSIADEADLEAINAGIGIEVPLYSSYDETPAADNTGNIVVPQKCCAFSVSVVKVENSEAVGNAIFDACAEVSVGKNTSEAVPRFWIWDDAQFSLVTLRGGESAFDYEGPPIQPRLFVRSGMIENVSPRDQEITFVFGVTIVMRGEYASEKITISSPYSAPPFMPIGTYRGWFIFMDAPANPLPGVQPCGIKRTFQTKTLLATLQVPSFAMIDARIYGGPWNASVVIGSTASSPANIQANMQQLLAMSVPAPFDQPYLDTATDTSVVLRSGRPVGALHISAYAVDGTEPVAAEILCTYP